MEAPKTSHEQLRIGFLSPKGILIVFSLMMVITYYDRGGLSSVLSTLQSELHLSNTEAGLLQSVFMIGYIISSPLFAQFASNYHPLKMMALGLLVWSLAVVLCGFSPNYYVLLLSRAITGIGEASFICLGASFINLAAPPAQRSVWLSIFYTAIPVGYALGYMGGGFFVGYSPLGEYWSWRLFFFTEAVLMVPFIAISLCCEGPKSVEDMERGLLHSDGNGIGNDIDSGIVIDNDMDIVVDSDYNNDNGNDMEIEQHGKALYRETWSNIILLTKNKLFVFLVLGYAAQTFVIGGVAFFGVKFSHEYLGYNHKEAGLLFGAVTLISGVLGTVIGGLVLDKLILRKKNEEEESNPSLSHSLSESDPTNLFSRSELESKSETESFTHQIPNYQSLNQSDHQTEVNLSSHVNEHSVSITQAIYTMLAVSALAIPFCLAPFLMPKSSFFFLIIAVGEFFLFCGLAPTNAAILWSIPLAYQPLAVAMTVMCIHILGDAISPVIIGALLDKTGSWPFSMTMLCTMLLPCCIFWFIALYYSLEGQNSKKREEEVHAGTPLLQD